MELIKLGVAVYQRDISKPLPDIGSSEYNFLLNIANEVRILVFSEYFYAGYSKKKNKEDYLRASQIGRNWLTSFSKNENCLGTLIIGGSTLVCKNQKIFNESSAWFEGEIINSYQKRYLFEEEKKILTPGKNIKILQHPYTKESIQILIGSDILLENPLRPSDFIAIPSCSWNSLRTTLPNNPPQKEKILITNSQKSNEIILKACSIGKFNHFFLEESTSPKLKGESFIAQNPDFFEKSSAIDWTGALIYYPNSGYDRRQIYTSKTTSLFEFKEIPEICQKIMEKIKLPLVITLHGHLGSGKTTLVREIASKFGVQDIQSPTFNLIHRHEGMSKNSQIEIIHSDFYRLPENSSINDLGFDAEENQILILEWPNKIKFDWNKFGYSVLDIQIGSNFNSNKEQRIVSWTYIPHENNECS